MADPPTTTITTTTNTTTTPHPANSAKHVKHTKNTNSISHLPASRISRPKKLKPPPTPVSHITIVILTSVGTFTLGIAEQLMSDQISRWCLRVLGELRTSLSISLPTSLSRGQFETYLYLYDPPMFAALAAALLAVVVGVVAWAILSCLGTGPKVKVKMPAPKSEAVENRRRYLGLPVQEEKEEMKLEEKRQKGEEMGVYMTRMDRRRAEMRAERLRTHPDF
ncbi:hypothetical protein EDC01DRAFT_488217 [Geopyxis carbonaria]|nr:hypothetical protein EDC01DRAFT_488217 [Geopyxis carbonaria]